jgi:2-hydroxychromene-2-carboxylate isomerase
MSKSVEFHFDFGSPNAYLAHRVVPGIEARTGIKIQYVPVLIGGVFKATNNKSPMEALAGIKNKPEYNALETRRFISKHGITEFAPNPFFPINTLQLMRAAIGAEKLGVAQEYIDLVFKGMWELGLNLGDMTVCEELLSQAGFNAAEVMACCADPKIKQTLIEYTSTSVARGNFGSPTFFVGDEMYFGKDRLDEVEAEIIRQAQST